MFKSERREISRRNQRKMKVNGKGVFTMRDAQRKRDQEWEKARKNKRVSPNTI
jgi:hypothetical protein